jgi:glycerophosphoryl diester phosphodiesterase
VYQSLPRPTIYAHRGASAYAPENTLAAFQLALRQSADAVELDAKLSADGQVVVIHDQTVDRTTDGQGKVSQLTLRQLKELDAGSHFDASFRGEQIPTLEEVFEAVGRHTMINVELTNYASIFDSLPDEAVKLVRGHGLEKRVMFSSFNPRALLRARKLSPEIPIALLALPGPSGSWARSWLGCLLAYRALHPEVRDVTPELVASVHKRGCLVNVYTVNQAEAMDRLLSMQVDGIFTDDPALARQAFVNYRSDIEQG